jgi:alpha-2-macroglobulin-like protein
LSESGFTKEIELEMETVYTDTKSSNEGYTVALCGLSLYNLKRKEAIEMSLKLSKIQKKSGSIPSEHSITGSKGDSRLIESTALAILCWLNDYEKFTNEVESGMRFIYSHSQNGKFGNTQSTCIALKAIIKVIPLKNLTDLKYDSIVKLENSRIGAASIVIDSKHIISLPLQSNSQETLEIDISEYLTTSGDHTIEVSMSEGSSYPYSLNVDYHSTKPENSYNSSIDISTKLSHTHLKEGEGSEIFVELTNLKDEKQGMAMGIIGIPGGLEVRHDQLKELVKSQTIDFYEIVGRNVAIYKKSLLSKVVLKFHLDVIARIPGKYVGPASRSYLYYCDEDKKWVDGLTCEIEAK